MACEDARLGVGDDKLHADGERRSDSCFLYLFFEGSAAPFAQFLCLWWVYVLVSVPPLVSLYPPPPPFV